MNLLVKNKNTLLKGKIYKVRKRQKILKENINMKRNGSIMIRINIFYLFNLVT